MMRMTRRFLIAATVVLSLGGAARDNPGAVEMGYGNDALQRLDIYPSAGLHAAPVLVFVHGGGWAIGDKSHVDVLPEYARRHGMLLVSVNYRLVPAVTAKQCAEDTASAVAKVRSIAEKNGGDPRRIFVVGHSAGAHLAALIATDPAYLAAYRMTPADLAGVVLLDGGTYDLTDGTKARKNAVRSDARRIAMYDKAVGGQELALSPIAHVSKGHDYPPFLIFHVAQRADSGEQSRRLAAALNNAGGNATVVAAQGKVHATIKREFGIVGDPVGERASTFLMTGRL